MSSPIEKYNVPVPRYTSYPTVPEWRQNPMDSELWLDQVRQAFNTLEHKEISLYLHLPFCERLCTYCGCNKRITVNHQVEEPYLQSLLHEWHTYKQEVGVPAIAEMHLGGGTPTFFSADNLEYLVSKLLMDSPEPSSRDYSFEAHPANTGKDHLSSLYRCGFKRLSLGIQDFSLKVQQAINRIQSFEQVAQVVDQARRIGYTSINFDLIYGLPFQTKQGMNQTFDLVHKLLPDRIAFYSYAHIPWKFPSQRGYSEGDLPSSVQKTQLYLQGRSRLLAMGYVDIGMDHFALKTDSLYKAFKEHQLHRNFMGYTTQNTKMLIGLGVSAISDVGIAYAQNHKTVEGYQQQVEAKGQAVVKGHLMTDQEQRVRSIIKEIICQGKVGLTSEQLKGMVGPAVELLEELKNDGLVKVESEVLELTPAGRQFSRNVCSVFDEFYWSKVENQRPVFSTSL